MIDLITSALVFALLCAAAGLGHLMLRRLPETHRSRDTLDFSRLAASLLVTFTALVLGLLIASVNAGFGKTETDLRAYAANIIRLTSSLEDFGPETLPIRTQLRVYTASALASTWPEEPRPAGSYPKAIARSTDFDASNLTDLLRRMETEVRGLKDGNADQTALKAACAARLGTIIDERWLLIGEAHSSITLPFFYMMLFWLFVVFFSFGMSAPANWVAVVFILIIGISVAGAVFVILELDGPLDGLVKVSSEPLRHALLHLDWSLRPDPAAP